MYAAYTSWKKVSFVLLLVWFIFYVGIIIVKKIFRGLTQIYRVWFIFLVYWGFFFLMQYFILHYFYPSKLFLLLLHSPSEISNKENYKELCQKIIVVLLKSTNQCGDFFQMFQDFNLNRFLYCFYLLDFPLTYLLIFPSFFPND